MPKKFTSNCRRGLLRRRELDRARDTEARVVDENVDAPIAAQDLCHGGVHLRLVRYVRLQMRHARLRVFGAAAELVYFQTAVAQGARGVQADAELPPVMTATRASVVDAMEIAFIFFEFFKYSIKPAAKLQWTSCELFLTPVTARPRAH